MDGTHLESKASRPGFVAGGRKEGRSARAHVAGERLRPRRSRAERSTSAHGPATPWRLAQPAGEGEPTASCWGNLPACLATGASNSLVYFFYFISYIHGMQNLHLFLLGHMREPLAKIIIYEAREREGERGREGREGGRKGERSKRLSIIRDTGDAH